MRKALLNLTMEETIKMFGKIVVAALIFVLVFWGLVRVQTFGEYFNLSPSGGNIELVDHEVEGGVFKATVQFSNTMDQEQDMWVMAAGLNHRSNSVPGVGPAPSQSFDRYPDNAPEERITLSAGEDSGEVVLSNSPSAAGCELEIRLKGECGGRLLCSYGRTLDSVKIQLSETVGVASKWEGKCQ